MVLVIWPVQVVVGERRRAGVRVDRLDLAAELVVVVGPDVAGRVRDRLQLPGGRVAVRSWSASPAGPVPLVLQQRGRLAPGVVTVVVGVPPGGGSTVTRSPP